MTFVKTICRSLPVLVGAAIVLFSCNTTPQTNNGEAAQPFRDTVKDTHTLSNADSILMKHLDLDIAVNFDNHTITGIANWQIDNKNHCKELRLDSYGLQIDSVFVDGQKTTFTKGAFVPFLGQALHIPVNGAGQKVAIYYKTTDSAQALQWLSPEQTMGKKLPFLYTQSESVYARSWIPCADGPGIRFTYNARVHVPKELMALMSAENAQQKNNEGVYDFKMDIPIPAYLMALAVGDITFKAVDERTGVYTEPAMIDKAAYELAEMGKMVQTAEKLYGAYRWGRYDVLVLPPGFPIGGMENPKLTFCTPTIIAGDRSLANLIAHELAHNWSGNLVTNRTWNDIWMNEGFTVYFERRITEAMNDKSYVDMLWELGYQDLEKSVEEKGKDSKDSWLKLNVVGRDPDECLSDIPYEKGSLWLWKVERAVGREKMDAFLKKYFDDHAFKTISTEEFLAYLQEHLIKGDTALEQKLNIDAWIYGPGIPADAPRANGERFAKVDAARNAFLKDGSASGLSVNGWSTHEWLHFLRKMPNTLTLQQMSALDGTFHFTNTGNSEIADLWYIMAVRAQYKQAFTAMENFASRVGRQKFLLPLYEALVKNNQAALAKKMYKTYKMNYHPLTQTKIEKLVR